MSFLRKRGCTKVKRSDYKYFSKARQIAMISDFPKTRIGCIAVYQGRILDVGCNTNKTHRTQKYYNRYREFSEYLPPKLHAEIKDLGIRVVLLNGL